MRIVFENVELTTDADDEVLELCYPSISENLHDFILPVYYGTSRHKEESSSGKSSFK